MNIIFMGSSTFSLPAIREINNTHNVLCVYTSAPKPKNRGMTLAKTCVQEFAEEYEIECFNPATLKGEADNIRAFSPDVIVVAAYGLIIPSVILEIPKYGCINIHGSLLPRWRGAAPVQYSLLNGDDVTGVTIMRMDKGMDTGDVLLEHGYMIKETDNAESLMDTLAQIGAASVVEVLGDINSYMDRRVKQDNSLATYTKKILKQDMELDFTKSANEVVNMVRGFYPNAWCKVGGILVKVLGASVLDSDVRSEPGMILDSAMSVSCGTGAVKFDLVKPESKKAMSGSDFMLSRRNLILKKVGI